MIRRLPPFIAVALVGLTLLLVLPAAASAAPPMVRFGSVDITGFTTVTIRGFVNPEGETTTYRLAWDLNSSEWCASGNTSGSPANTTDPTDLGFTDDTEHAVSVDLTGLTAQTEYCAMLIATNADGDGDFGLAVWRQPSTPVVVTSDGTATGHTTATIDGSVNPEDSTVTYRAWYAPAASAWCTTSGASGTPSGTNPVPLGFSDHTPHDVSVDLTGLTAGIDYCARLTAGNGFADASGAQVTWSEDLPDALTFDGYSTDSTTATVEGLVSPAGAGTTYQVQYDVATSDWCTSGGAIGTPASATSPTSDGLDLSDSGPQFVTVDLTGLTEKTAYCAQLIATNGSEEVDGGQVTWTQGASTAETFDIEPTGNTTATLDGDLNPAGKATTYVVQYDLASSGWCENDGSSGSPSFTTAPVDLTVADGTFHELTVDLGGLTPGEIYCGQLVATNSDGTSEGGLVEWEQPSPPPPPFTLIVRVSGAGHVTSSPAGIDCPSMCSASFAPGTQVTLTATGSTFFGWGGVLACFPPPGSPASRTCTFTLGADTTVLARFAPALPQTMHALTVQLAGAGSGTVTSSPAGIDCGDTCSAMFVTGTQVTLTATPDKGSYFLGWSGGACSGAGTCTLTPTSDQSVTATFRPVPQPHCTVRSTASKVALNGTRAGVLTLKIRCSQAVSFTLGGKITIKTKVGKKTKTSHASVKAAHGSARAGVTRKVRLKVPKAALTKLKQHAAESISFSLTARNANGTTRATASIRHLRG